MSANGGPIRQRLERAAMAFAALLALFTEPLAAFLWHRLGRWSLAAVTAALVALLATPWVWDMPLWWTLVGQLPLSWILGGVTSALLLRFFLHRGRAKLMADMDSIGGRHLWYGLDGKPIGITEANELLGKHLARSVAITDIDGWRISTVFLVLDHNHTGQGAPVLWETMVFNSDGDVEGHQRYTSREDASRGHDEYVALVRNVFRQMRTLGMPEVPKPNGEAS